MKTILITGSTDGIGKIAALNLANEGHRIIIHGRNSEKVQKTVDELIAESSNQNVSGIVADFANINSIHKMVEVLTKDLDHLDVLINNAGVFLSNVDKNAQGYDMRVMVNYFAPYILTNGLLDLLLDSDSPRVINLSSAAQANIDDAVLEGAVVVSAQEAYAQSKLAITMWSFYLAQKNTDLTVIALNPGSLLNTKMVREAYGRHWSTADKGADIITELALGNEALNHSGEYFDNDKGSYAKAHPMAYEPIELQKLMTKTVEILELS